ncbi:MULTISPECIES: lytic transglycosylase domain-containing protein [unclassified Duganella]|uniref:lytic transglycosylase domain-containing protein n=1 Tax=unclassified Duganella TaxID=2636909 RepID=UPI00087F12B6|nr:MULTISPECIES: lytic transglycosylase domain-containing protein [unclassified Duganella]SDG97028.1 soluble lytic murein transglycosylase [Duganella sp. OV458]SDJ45349.1 soluble lytic murein transglycosylase [Duganella sp. OV510]
MISASKWIAGAVVVAFTSLAHADDISADSRRDDDAFLLLRDAVRQDDATKADFYAARLASYSIPSYVDYYRLKSRLKDATQADIRDFFKRYQGQAIVDRLRNDWLLELGRKRDWATFDEQYPLFVLNDDTQVKCYALISRALKGQKVADEARALLTSPSVYGQPCADLIATLYQNGQFNTEDLYAQLRLSGEFNATGQARRIVALLDGPEKKAVQAVDLPTVAVAKGIGPGKVEHQIFIVALGRLAKTSTKLAVLGLNKAMPKMSSQEQQQAWAAIALQSSYSLSPETTDYWKRSSGAPLSIDQIQWKTRIAMRNGDWRQVENNIRAMPQSLRNDPAWVYWLGRALMARDGVSSQPNGEALQLFRSISEQSNYYGQLALEESGKLITIPTPGAPISQAEIAPIAANPNIQRALKFFSMRLRFEGTREWNWALRGFNEREHLAAAEYARQNNILDRMVNTSERTRIQVDYSQRFPSPHNDVMHPATQTLGLDKAWVYGLIRQESRFIMDAQSHVGASGLMQVMPSTGRWVAKKIGLSDFAQEMLSDVRYNIMLGTNYLNMVLGNMDGNEVLATAAYNAGPGRLRTWRATLSKPMDATVFIESIPYFETRTYVKNVMSNATYYAALFEGRPQSLKARLGTVGPKGYTQAEEQETSFGPR